MKLRKHKEGYKCIRRVRQSAEGRHGKHSGKLDNSTSNVLEGKKYSFRKNIREGKRKNPGDEQPQTIVKEQRIATTV